MSTTIQKTNTSMSPLLQPVVTREYTKGFSNIPGAEQNISKPPIETQAPPVTNNNPAPGPNFQKPPTVNEKSFDSPPGDDQTKQFSFDENTDNESDLQDGEQGPGVTIPAGTARTFANTIGNLIQMYLPKATYGYVKIDIDNVRMHVEKGNLTFNWIGTFTEMNKSAEEGLQISNEAIKMWKAAFQHYLEYKQVAIANPETEFFVATAVLLVDQGARAYGIKRQLEGYMKEALEQNQPYASHNTQTTTTKTDNNEDRKAA
jgi:hypothetical protein